MISHPPFLKPGSLVGITCPSSYVSFDRVAYAVTVLEKWGFKVQLGKTIGPRSSYLSGTDDERLADLQEMMDNPEVDAILMGRGGYGMSRIIDRIDFTSFQKKPKWICGFSDIVVLHNHLQAHFNMPSLHSPMCGAFKPETENEPYLKTLFAALTGTSLSYHMPPSPFNRNGTAEAILTGGNLAILAHLTGSSSEVDTAGKILFIEDIGEYMYNVDRMLLNLKRAGKLENLAALIVGYFTDMQDTTPPFGSAIHEIVLDKVKEYNYPVSFNFPAGHEDINFTFTLGATHSLKVTGNGSILDLVT